jgi:hypothetical protein
MSFQTGQAVGQLVAVLVGGGLATGTTLLIHHLQRRDAARSERRTRENAATSRLAELTVTLLRLDRAPGELREIEQARRLARGKSLDHLPPAADEEAERAWERQRDDLLLAFKTASMDLSDVPLRKLLEQAHESLLYPYGPWDQAQQSESTTRRIICQYVLECLGAFRREEPLPAEPNDYIDTVAFVQDWIGWQEEQERLEEEDRAKRRAERSGAAAKKRQELNASDTSEGE